jgi:translation elongation factor EF-G
LALCRQSFYGDDPTAEVLLSAVANALPRPSEAAALLEAVATLPAPRVASECASCAEPSVLAVDQK